MPRNPLIARRKRIRRSIAKLAGGGQRRYPQRLRGMIADYCRTRVDGGVPLTRVCSELGVGHPTLVRMLEEAKAPRLRRVRIAAPKPNEPEAGLAPVVRGPAGIVIEGLDVEGVAALVRALS
jgi:hypothetical protein